MNVFQKCYECTLKDVAKAQELPWSTPTAAFCEGFAILMTAAKLPACNLNASASPKIFVSIIFGHF